MKIKFYHRIIKWSFYRREDAFEGKPTQGFGCGLLNLGPNGWQSHKLRGGERAKDLPAGERRHVIAV